MRPRIDWNWVRKELFMAERIPPIEKGALKHIIHIYVDRCLKKAKSLARPKAVTLAKKIVKKREGSIELGSGIKLSGKRLSSYLKKADSARIFLVTVGGKIEKEASLWMSKGEPLFGYLLDRIGSLAVESAAEDMEKNFRKRYAAKGKSVSMRFSPGYCDWPIEAQFVLEKVIDFSKIGVRLNDGCMMVPKKSISAMVGVGPKNAFPKSKSQCRTCDKKDCDYRRYCR